MRVSKADGSQATDLQRDAGMLAKTNAARRTYASGDVVGTGFVHDGVTDALTTGVNIQTRSRKGALATGLPQALAPSCFRRTQRTHDMLD